MKQKNFLSKSLKFSLLTAIFVCFLAIAVSAQIEDHHYFFEGSPADNGTDDDALTEVGGLVYGTGQIGLGAVCNSTLDSSLAVTGWTSEALLAYSLTWWMDINDANQSGVNNVFYQHVNAADNGDIWLITKQGADDEELRFNGEDNAENVSIELTGLTGFHHFALVAEDDEPMTVYLDGVFFANSSATLNPIGTTATTAFFCSDRNSNNHLNGTIDDLRVFQGDALSSINISNIYCQGSGTQDALNDISGCLPVAAQKGKPVFNSSNINNSNPRINEVIEFGQEFADNVSLSNFRFFHNQSGSFVNDTAVTITGLTFNGTKNLTVTTVRNTVIGWGWHIMDSAGFINISEVQTVTIGNTAPETPTILFPTADLLTNLQPLDLNVTFNEDADGDTITIHYYIDGILNQSSATNTTLNISDATYILNVSLEDSGGFFSANATVSFTLDSTIPTLTVNQPAPDQVFNKLTEDIIVDLTCFDLNLTSLNYTIFNSSDTITIVGNNSINIDTLTINDVVNTTPLGEGAYTFNATCFNMFQIDSEEFTINITSILAAPAAAPEEILPLEGVANIVAMFVMFLIVGGAFLTFFGRKRQ